MARTAHQHPHGGNFSYFTRTAASSGKAADLLNFSLDDGGAFVTYDSLNAGNQHYYFDYAGNGYFHVCNQRSSKCLAIQGARTANGGSVVQLEKNGSLHQQWRLLPVGAAIAFVAPSAPTNLVATAGATKTTRLRFVKE